MTYTSVDIFGNYEQLRISSDEDTVLIRGRDVTISLSLTDKQCDALRKALDVVVTVEDKTMVEA